MNIPIFLTVFIAFVIALQYMIRYAARQHGNPYGDYLDREREADMTIKRDALTDDLFVVPDTKNLPFQEYGDMPENKKLIRLQETVSRMQGLKMVRFGGVVSNTDLKLQYGVNNLDKLTTYESNYNGYIRALTEWGEALFEQASCRDAETVLRTAVDFGSDLSKTYIFLAKAYIEQDKTEELAALKERVLHSDLDRKSRILEHFY